MSENRLGIDSERMTGKQEVIPGQSRCGKFGIRRTPGEQVLPNAAAFPDFHETRFSVVRSEARGSLARDGFLKPFGSLPNALSFSNSLRKLRLALRRMPAHSL